MRVFISHSVQTHESRTTLDQIRAELERAGHEVFVDADVLLGQEWRSILYHELAVCDAAVVLLDAFSLQKRWVQREVDLLLWRRAFDENLAVLPVLLDNTAVSSVREAGFAEFTEHQFVLAGRQNLAPHAVAIEVLKRFASVPHRLNTPMDEWLCDIEVVLHRIGHLQNLRRAAAALGVSSEDIDQVMLHGGCRFLAHQFLGPTPENRTVDAVREVLYCADTDTLRKLATLIAPTWVDHAASLPLIMPNAGERHVAILNARDYRTAVDYIRRATCHDARVRLQQIPGIVGEAAVNELRSQWQAAVLRLLGGDPARHTFADIPPTEVRDGPSRPAFLVVDANAMPMGALRETIAEIRTRFKWLVIVVIVGSEAPSRTEVAAWALPDAKLLEPTLAAYAEFKAQRTIGELYSMIDCATGDVRI